MPRLKTRATASKKTTRKPSAKRTTASDNSSKLVNPADQLFTMVTTSATSLEKEVAALKKALSKLRTQLTKSRAKQTALKNKRVVAQNKAKAKPTATAKNQLIRAKDAYNKVHLEAQAIAAEVSKIRDQLAELKVSQVKQSALSKLLKKFEKDWDQKEKSTTKAKKVKKTIRSSSKKASSKIESTAGAVDHADESIEEFEAEMADA